LASRILKLSVAVVLILIVALGAYYTSTLTPKSVGPTSTTQAATGGPTGTIVVGSTEYPALGISPFNNTFDTGFNIGHQIYDSIVLQRADGTIIPGLATSWSANPDSTIWTFQLRKGVRFHDGTPFNASAVKFSIDVAFPTTFGQLTIGPYFKSVEVVDDYTIRFNLKTSYAGFPAILSTATGLIASPSAYQKDPKNYGTFVNVGTGPFKFVQWIPRDRVILEANTNYWDPSRVPKVKTFIWRFFSDPNAMVLSLRSGEINVLYLQAPKSQVTTLSQDPNLKYVKNLDPFTYFLGLNRKFKPLDNLYVRKAIAYALDLNKIAGLANATRAYSIFPPQIFGQVDAAAQKNFTYNLPYAKSLMAKAGYPNGYDGNLELYYPPQQFGAELSDIVTVIQRNLADIGLKIVLKPVDPAAQSAIVNAQNAAMAIYRAGTLSSDPDFLATFTYALNQLNSWSRWAFNNSTADEWVTQARVAASAQDRVKLYQQIQNTFDTQPSHLIFLYNNIHYVFFNNKVQGINSVGVSPGFEIDWTMVYARES